MLRVMQRSRKPRSCGPLNGPPAKLGTRRTRSSLLRLGRQRGNAAVGRIDDRPRLAPLRQIQILEPPVVGTAGTGRQTVDRLLLGGLADLRHLGGRDVLETAAFESGRTLERRRVLVGVRVGALQIGIAPRCARGFPRLAGGSSRHRKHDDQRGHDAHAAIMRSSGQSRTRPAGHYDPGCAKVMM